MQTIRCLVVFLMFGCFVGSAQHKAKITAIDDDPTPIRYKWMGTESRVLTSMKLIYKKPRGFREVSESECFNDYPGLKSMYACLSNQLQSKDCQFIPFLSTYRPFGSRDSILMVQHLYPNNPSGGSLDIMHINQIKALIRDHFGKDAVNDWKSYVSYYPEDVSKNKFHADTVIRFSITLQPEDYYKKEFKYVDVLCLQKNGRGFIHFYCFYTDKAKTNLDDYWAKIEGVLRYED